MTSLSMISTPYKLQLNPIRSDDQNNSYTFQQLAPEVSWIVEKPINFHSASRFCYDPLSSNCTLMVRIRYTNLWIENSVHHETLNCFWDNLLPNSQKFSSFKIEKSPLHLHSFYSTIWKLHIHLTGWEKYPRKKSWWTCDHSTRMIYFHWLCT